MPDFPARQVIAYTVVALFVVFFFSNGLSNHIETARLLSGNGRFPDFSVYQTLKSLSPEEFPLDVPKRRVIVVGDIHGMPKPFATLLEKLSYDPTSDALVHVGDILTKGSHNGSMEVLAYMATNNITGVRGNHDQRVIEWRGWINWIRSLPGGSRWLEDIHSKWLEAEAYGAIPDPWLKDEKKKSKSKWWGKIPDGWTLFSDHFNVAHAMSEGQYEYLVALPLSIHIPSAHAYIVHAGLLPSDPHYAPDHHRQPLSHIPALPKDKGKGHSANETSVLRRLQELAVLNEVPQNKVPWNVLNMRSIINNKISKDKEGTSWSKIWKHDMSRCEGFDHDVHVTKPKKDLLSCYPSTVIYGHAASRGLDIKRWSIGLDSGCIYGRRLTALVLGAKSSKRQERDNSESINDKSTIPFGDNGEGEIVSVSC